MCDRTAPVDAAWYEAWKREQETLRAEFDAVTQAIKSALGSGGPDLLFRLDTAYGAREMHEQQKLVEMICAHLPGMAPAIRLIYEHVTEAPSERVLGCCTRLPID